MKYKESLTKHLECREAPTDELIQEYLKEYEAFILSMPLSQQNRECVSGYNRFKRMKFWSSTSLGIDVNVGDICYIDYGQAYINEAGYQHFGLVIATYNHKLLVVPMTSNTNTISQSVNKHDPTKGHLYYIGKVEGLNKPSVLFLNDCKFINSGRIISINGHICPKGPIFDKIRTCVKEIIFGPHMIE